MSKALSLIEKDSFFSDSFFKDAWEDFDRALQLVLDKFDNQGLKVDTGSRSTCHDLYRKIRSNKIDEDLYASQALQVNEKDGKFQCVMDVKDFNPKELQVRVVDDRVIVEGKYEKKSEDGSSMSSKSFYKEFTLPKVANLDLVSSALSKDGVLTIKAPKKEGAEVAPASGAVTSSVSSVVQQQSSSVSSSASSNVQEFSSSSASSKVQESFSSTSSSFSSSSSKTVSMSSSSAISSSVTETSTGMEALDDMAKDMKDRLVFSHETVNVKLPENK